MTSTTTVPVQPTTSPAEQSEARRALSGLWPLAAAGAGITSFVFTSLTSRFLTDAETEGGVAAVYAAVEDDGVRARLDAWSADLVVGLVERYGPELTSVISSTIHRWDAAEASDKIELHVGRDLQFIRLNGTIVGALVGLVIHTVSHFL